MRWLQADRWHDLGLGRRLFIVTAVVLATLWAYSYPAVAGSHAGATPSTDRAARVEGLVGSAGRSPARADSTVGQSFAPSADPSPGIWPQVLGYDLGEATIAQQVYGPGSPFHDMPVRLQGILAIPAGEGPFPVARIAHGSYPFCTAPLVDGEVDPLPLPPGGGPAPVRGLRRARRIPGSARLSHPRPGPLRRVQQRLWCGVVRRTGHRDHRRAARRPGGG